MNFDRSPPHQRGGGAARCRSARSRRYFAAIAPHPDPNVGTELGRLTKEADVAELEALNHDNNQAFAAIPPPDPATPSSVSVAVGSTEDQVKGILGEPNRIIKSGAKTIFFYQDLKITFNLGKVTDVQ